MRKRITIETYAEGTEGRLRFGLEAPAAIVANGWPVSKVSRVPLTLLFAFRDDDDVEMFAFAEHGIGDEYDDYFEPDVLDWPSDCVAVVMLRHGEVVNEYERATPGEAGPVARLYSFGARPYSGDQAVYAIFGREVDEAGELLRMEGDGLQEEDRYGWLMSDKVGGRCYATFDDEIDFVGEEWEMLVQLSDPTMPIDVFFGAAPVLNLFRSGDDARLLIRGSFL